MSEQWKDLLEKSREAAKSAMDRKEDTAELVNSLCPKFEEVQNVIRNYLAALSKLSTQEGCTGEESEVTESMKPLTLDTRRAIRFTMYLLSVESTRIDVQNTACGTFELHKPISNLISDRNCDSKCRLMAAQVLCNLGTCNATTARKILNDIKTSPSESEVTNIMLEKLSIDSVQNNVVISRNHPTCSWAQMIQSSSGSGNRKKLEATIAALYNALVSVDSDQDDYAIKFATHLSKDSILMCNMIRYILPSEVINQSKEGETAMDASDLSDEATEWISRILEKLCSKGMLPNMYRSLGSNEKVTIEENVDEISSIVITPEQLVLLHCIGSSAAAYAQTLHTSNHSEIHPLGGACDFETMKSTFEFLGNEYCYLRQKLKDIEGDSEEHYGGENACIDNAATTIIDMLSNSMSVDEKIDGNSFLGIRLHVGQTTNLIPSLLLDLGILVDRLGIENRGINARELKIEESDQNLVTSIVRSIGNVCYRCSENQDLVRKTTIPVPQSSHANVKEYTQLPMEACVTADNARNGLHVLLSCTSFAYGCFTLREWAIVAIRNVLEGNEDNQKQVEELEAQKALETPELQNLGVKVNLDKRGKVQVTQNP